MPREELLLDPAGKAAECRAYAKVNLGLDVTGTREDGYHLVRMVMQNVSLFDTVKVERTETPGFTLSSDDASLPLDGRNLMVKAAELMASAYRLPGGLRMRLNKRIPVAAGMAGGSSDAAAVLHCINRLFDLRLSLEELQKIGLKLGADVPFCLLRHTALAEGIGEILTPVEPCPACRVVIAKPSFPVSTKAVYQRLRLDEKTLHPDIDGMVAALRRGELRGVTDRMSNVLENVTAADNPLIGRLKDSLLEDGALNALMSGSGPTVFGLFDDAEKAEAAADKLRARGDLSAVFTAELLRE